ncbi:MAG: sugar ABC transporter permease [Chloroflexi bacterium]|nr:sugar ABC transporter permease [Chloroflexota bacterium]
MSVRRLDRDRIIAILLIFPSILAVAVFVYAFIAWTGWASLLKWNDMLPLRSLPPLPKSWAIFPPRAALTGLENFVRLLASDQRFQTDLKNTVVFTVLFIVACLALGLLLAVLLDQKIRGEAFFRAIFLFPMSVSFIVTGVVWRSGYTMALYLAGLRGIPDELREAGRVDGASEWQVFRHITLPLLQPVTLSAIIILGHISLKIFDLSSSMTGPGAGFSTDVPAYYLFDTVFRGNHFARGAAIAILLLLMVSVLVVPYLIYSYRTEVER